MWPSYRERLFRRPPATNQTTNQLIKIWRTIKFALKSAWKRVSYFIRLYHNFGGTNCYTIRACASESSGFNPHCGFTLWIHNRTWFLPRNSPNCQRPPSTHNGLLLRGFKTLSIMTIIFILKNGHPELDFGCLLFEKPLQWTHRCNGVHSMVYTGRANFTAQVCRPP